MCPGLKPNYAVDAVRAKNAEPAFAVSAKVNETSDALRGTGERDFVARQSARDVLILNHHLRSRRHWPGQAEIGKRNNLRSIRGGGRRRGVIVRFHSSIGTEEM